MEVEEIKKIKETIEELLQKMTIIVFSVELKESSLEDGKKSASAESYGAAKEAIDLDITIEEPQVLIGQNGQTLFELQRLLRIMLNKKLKKDFYVRLDINDYKKKKIEYLKNLAIDLADEVSKTKENKTLPPMPAYERRVIHAELSERKDVVTESQGEGSDRSIVIKPAA